MKTSNRATFGPMVVLLAFCSLFAGCTGYQYISSPHYVPVNTEKGTMTGNFSMHYFQMGYAVSNHFSVFTSGYYRNNRGGMIKETFLTKENGGAITQTDRQRNLELGFTYFNKPAGKLCFELVSGLGIGSVQYSNSVDEMQDYEFDMRAQKMNFFIQPDFSLKFNKYLDLTFFNRINQNYYYYVSKKLELGSKTEPVDYDQYFAYNQFGSLFFMEPGIQFRAGAENVKFQCMYSNVINLGSPGIRYRHNNLYLGISININLTRDSE